MNNYFCTGTGRDCSCPPPQPPCPPQQQACPVCPQQETVITCCPCGEDFRRALELICCPQLQGLIDTATYAFITDNFVLGTPIAAAPAGTAPADNLTAPAATYVCGGDNCESLTVSGALYPTTEDGAALGTIVTQVALCRLDAISFDAADTGDGAAANFQTISQFLGQRLRPKRPQECTSLAEALVSASAVRASTLTAGPLVVQNSAILGKVGDVLVMANSTDSRFYFICADKVDFMG
ncbi:MAG: hypothetical protein IJO88_01440 [Oscillospiraceae bacterium]|nr:hypothetical protein [Oscillospiraceae bacterium]